MVPTIQIADAVQQATPPEVLAEVRAKLLDICDVLMKLPGDHPLWDSLLFFGIVVHVQSWRFNVRLEQPASLVVERVLSRP